MKPLIISDTRDKKPWYFEEDDFFQGTACKKVDYGDYTIEGLEHLIFIERKASCLELAKNITEKRFHKLMAASSRFKYKYIIVECPFDDVINYPHNENISMAIKNKIKVSSNMLLAFLVKIMVEYDINIMFADSPKNAQKLAYRILKQIVRQEVT